VFIDRGADILAVAHLDSVSNDDLFTVVKTNKEAIVFSRQLDDRLGVYVILDVLPALGIECDVLLTTGEETGQSTGAYFKFPDGKDYNWMFQFDRSGTDVVCYQYEDNDLTECLEAAGFYVADGLFSDISDMDDLGVKAFNVGTAYYDNHGEKSHAFLSELSYMISMFAKFYTLFKDEKLEHEYERYSKYGAYGGYYDYGYDESSRLTSIDSVDGMVNYTYDEIDQLEKTSVELEIYADFHEYFGVFVIGALFVLLSEVILSNTRMRTLP